MLDGYAYNSTMFGFARSFDLHFVGLYLLDNLIPFNALSVGKAIDHAESVGRCMSSTCAFCSDRPVMSICVSDYVVVLKGGSGGPTHICTSGYTLTLEGYQDERK